MCVDKFPQLIRQSNNTIHKSIKMFLLKPINVKPKTYI